jgi:hypothetical protein
MQSHALMRQATPLQHNVTRDIRSNIVAKLLNLSLRLQSYCNGLRLRCLTGSQLCLVADGMVERGAKIAPTLR